MLDEEYAVDRLRSMQDQSWAGIRDDEETVLRIAEHGPNGTEKDKRICRALAMHVYVELQFRVIDDVDLESL